MRDTMNLAAFRPVFGVKGLALKIRQVYYCVNAQAQDGKSCVNLRKPVHSWLTPEEARRLIDPLGLICSKCRRPLKWVRSEPLMQEQDR